MHVYEKVFDRVVTLAVVQQEELAVTSGAVTARQREDEDCRVCDGAGQ